MFRFAAIIFFALFLLSCEEKKLPYESIMFRSDGIKMWPDTILASFKDHIENSNFSIDDEKGNLLVKGKFSHGLRTGEWTYHPSDTQTVKINWSSFSNDTATINYPSDWTVHKSMTRPFQAT